MDDLFRLSTILLIAIVLLFTTTYFFVFYYFTDREEFLHSISADFSNTETIFEDTLTGSKNLLYISPSKSGLGNSFHVIYDHLKGFKNKLPSYRRAGKSTESSSDEPASTSDDAPHKVMVQHSLSTSIATDGKSTSVDVRYKNTRKNNAEDNALSSEPTSSDQQTSSSRGQSSDKSRSTKTTTSDSTDPCPCFNVDSGTYGCCGNNNLDPNAFSVATIKSKLSASTSTKTINDIDFKAKVDSLQLDVLATNESSDNLIPTRNKKSKTKSVPGKYDDNQKSKYHRRRRGNMLDTLERASSDSLLQKVSRASSSFSDISVYRPSVSTIEIKSKVSVDVGKKPVSKKQKYADKNKTYPADSDDGLFNIPSAFIAADQPRHQKYKSKVPDTITSADNLLFRNPQLECCEKVNAELDEMLNVIKHQQCPGNAREIKISLTTNVAPGKYTVNVDDSLNEVAAKDSELEEPKYGPSNKQHTSILKSDKQGKRKGNKQLQPHTTASQETVDSSKSIHVNAEDWFAGDILGDVDSKCLDICRKEKNLQQDSAGSHKNGDTARSKKGKRFKRKQASHSSLQAKESSKKLNSKSKKDPNYSDSIQSNSAATSQRSSQSQKFERKRKNKRDENKENSSANAKNKKASKKQNASKKNKKGGSSKKSEESVKSTVTIRQNIFKGPKKKDTSKKYDSNDSDLSSTSQSSESSESIPFAKDKEKKNKRSVSSNFLNKPIHKGGRKAKGSRKLGSRLDKSNSDIKNNKTSAKTTKEKRNAKSNKFAPTSRRSFSQNESNVSIVSIKSSVEIKNMKPSHGSRKKNKKYNPTAEQFGSENLSVSSSGSLLIEMNTTGIRERESSHSDTKEEKHHKKRRSDAITKTSEVSFSSTIKSYSKEMEKSKDTPRPKDYKDESKGSKKSHKSNKSKSNKSPTSSFRRHKDSKQSKHFEGDEKMSTETSKLSADKRGKNERHQSKRQSRSSSERKGHKKLSDSLFSHGYDMSPSESEESLSSADRKRQRSDKYSKTPRTKKGFSKTQGKSSVSSQHSSQSSTVDVSEIFIRNKTRIRSGVPDENQYNKEENRKHKQKSNRKDLSDDNLRLVESEISVKVASKTRISRKGEKQKDFDRLSRSREASTHKIAQPIKSFSTTDIRNEIPLSSKRKHDNKNYDYPSERRKREEEKRGLKISGSKSTSTIDIKAKITYREPRRERIANKDIASGRARRYTMDRTPSESDIFMHTNVHLNEESFDSSPVPRENLQDVSGPLYRPSVDYRASSDRHDGTISQQKRLFTPEENYIRPHYKSPIDDHVNGTSFDKSPVRLEKWKDLSGPSYRPTGNYRASSDIYDDTISQRRLSLPSERDYRRSQNISSIAGDDYENRRRAQEDDDRSALKHFRGPGRPRISYIMDDEHVSFSNGSNQSRYRSKSSKFESPDRSVSSRSKRQRSPEINDILDDETLVPYRSDQLRYRKISDKSKIPDELVSNRLNPHSKSQIDDVVGQEFSSLRDRSDPSRYRETSSTYESPDRTVLSRSKRQRPRGASDISEDEYSSMPNKSDPLRYHKTSSKSEILDQLVSSRSKQQRKSQTDDELEREYSSHRDRSNQSRYPKTSTPDRSAFGRSKRHRSPDVSDILEGKYSSKSDESDRLRYRRTTSKSQIRQEPSGSCCPMFDKYPFDSRATGHNFTQESRVPRTSGTMREYRESKQQPEHPEYNRFADEFLISIDNKNYNTNVTIDRRQLSITDIPEDSNEPSTSGTHKQTERGRERYRRKFDESGVCNEADSNENSINIYDNSVDSRDLIARKKSPYSSKKSKYRDTSVKSRVSVKRSGSRKINVATQVSQIIPSAKHSSSKIDSRSLKHDGTQTSYYKNKMDAACSAMSPYDSTSSSRRRSSSYAKEKSRRGRRRSARADEDASPSSSIEINLKYKNQEEEGAIPKADKDYKRTRRRSPEISGESVISSKGSKKKHRQDAEMQTDSTFSKRSKNKDGMGSEKSSGSVKKVRLASRERIAEDPNLQVIGTRHVYRKRSIHAKRTINYAVPVSDSFTYMHMQPQDSCQECHASETVQPRISHEDSCCGMDEVEDHQLSFPQSEEELCRVCKLPIKAGSMQTESGCDPPDATSSRYEIEENMSILRTEVMDGDGHLKENYKILCQSCIQHFSKDYSTSAEQKDETGVALKSLKHEISCKGSLSRIKSDTQLTTSGEQATRAENLKNENKILLGRLNQQVKVLIKQARDLSASMVQENAKIENCMKKKDEIMSHLEGDALPKLNSIDYDSLQTLISVPHNKGITNIAAFPIIAENKDGDKAADRSIKEVAKDEPQSFKIDIEKSTGNECSCSTEKILDKYNKKKHLSKLGKNGERFSNKVVHFDNGSKNSANSIRAKTSKSNPERKKSNASQQSNSSSRRIRGAKPQIQTNNNAFIYTLSHRADVSEPLQKSYYFPQGHIQLQLQSNDYLLPQKQINEISKIGDNNVNKSPEDLSSWLSSGKKKEQSKKYMSVAEVDEVSKRLSNVKICLRSRCAPKKISFRPRSRFLTRLLNSQYCELSANQQAISNCKLNEKQSNALKGMQEKGSNKVLSGGVQNITFAALQKKKSSKRSICSSLRQIRKHRCYKKLYFSSANCLDWQKTDSCKQISPSELRTNETDENTSLRSWYLNCVPKTSAAKHLCPKYYSVTFTNSGYEDLKQTYQYKYLRLGSSSKMNRYICNRYSVSSGTRRSRKISSHVTSTSCTIKSKMYVRPRVSLKYVYNRSRFFSNSTLDVESREAIRSKVSYSGVKFIPVKAKKIYRTKLLPSLQASNKSMSSKISLCPEAISDPNCQTNRGSGNVKRLAHYSDLYKTSIKCNSPRWSEEYTDLYGSRMETDSFSASELDSFVSSCTCTQISTRNAYQSSVSLDTQQVSQEKISQVSSSFSSYECSSNERDFCSEIKHCDNHVNLKSASWEAETYNIQNLTTSSAMSSAQTNKRVTFKSTKFVKVTRTTSKAKICVQPRFGVRRIYYCPLGKETQK